MSKSINSKKKCNSVQKIYKILYETYGTQKWWPGDTIDEIIIGAILTQNTAWTNVEKSIDNLKKKNLLTLENIIDTNDKFLSSLIKPSGYFNTKTKYLKNIARWYKSYNFDPNTIKNESLKTIRKRLLNVVGIGHETCDSILLYAFNYPVFVIDKYTYRILSRHNIIHLKKYDYSKIQNLFHLNLNTDTQLFNEYHALLVKIGKDFCYNKNPNCNDCPINSQIESVE